MRADQRDGFTDACEHALTCAATAAAVVAGARTGDGQRGIPFREGGGRQREPRRQRWMICVPGVALTGQGPGAGRGPLRA